MEVVGLVIVVLVGGWPSGGDGEQRGASPSISGDIQPAGPPRRRSRVVGGSG